VGGEVKRSQWPRQAYLSTEVRLSMIKLYSRYFQTEEGTLAGAEIEGLAFETGGDVAELHSPSEIGLAHDLADELMHYYVLQIALPQLDKPTPWRLEVVDLSVRRRKDLKLTLRAVPFAQSAR
jgi:hypothetical protein